jgi:hypothetical protein
MSNATEPEAPSLMNASPPGGGTKKRPKAKGLTAAQRAARKHIAQVWFQVWGDDPDFSGNKEHTNTITLCDPNFIFKMVDRGGQVDVVIEYDDKDGALNPYSVNDAFLDMAKTRELTEEQLDIVNAALLKPPTPLPPSKIKGEPQAIPMVTVVFGDDLSSAYLFLTDCRLARFEARRQHALRSEIATQSV